MIGLIKGLVHVPYSPYHCYLCTLFKIIYIEKVIAVIKVIYISNIVTDIIRHDKLLMRRRPEVGGG